MIQIHSFGDFVVVIADRSGANTRGACQICLRPYDLSEVSFNVDSVNCVTDQEHLPADSKVVKETWLRVNADGSPDRRYKNNKKCLVCEYGRLRIRSDSGLNIYFLLSNSDNVDQFKAILPL